MDDEDSLIRSLFRSFFRWAKNIKVDGFPDGFQFVLPFLDFRSRLNVKGVSKALKEALTDPFVWVDLRIECTRVERIEWGVLSHKLTNEILLKLVERAEGHLKSLFLEHASEVTDEALRKIFELNPGLERISVPHCRGLDVDKFVSLVEAHSLKARTKGLPGISQVRLQGLLRILPEHVVRLENTLGVSRFSQKEALLSRRYFGGRQGNNEATKKRPVDVEVCPNCENVTLLYDCTKHSPRLKDDGCGKHISSKEDEDYVHLEENEYKNRKSCRSCTVCIPRCGLCGSCMKTVPYSMMTVCSNLDCSFAIRMCNSRGRDRPSCPRHGNFLWLYGYDIPCNAVDANCDSNSDHDDMPPICGKPSEYRVSSLDFWAMATGLD